MGADYYSKLVAGVKLSSILEEVTSSATKYNPNTGEPYQIPVTKYKIFGELVDSLSELSIGKDGELDSIFHCASDIWDLMQYGTPRWKEEVIFGIKIKESDWYKNLQPVSIAEIEDAKIQVMELLHPYYPALDPTLHLILRASC